MKKKVFLFFIFSFLSANLQSFDSYYYESPFKLAFTVAGTVGLSKLFYEASNGVALHGFSFFSKKEPIIKNSSQIPIGLIRLQGEIFEVEAYLDYFEQVRNDNSIKGLLISIESGGGSAGASQLLFRELKKVSEVKPVVVFTSISCCSGAYHIATASNWIIASDFAEIGSIGTVLPTKQFADKIKGMIGGDTGKVIYNIIKSGKYKFVGNPFNKLTPEQKDYLQEGCDRVYEHFCTMVAQQRNLNIDEKNIWAEGQHFIALRAIELGLIDQIGDWSDAKAKIKELVVTRNTNLTGELNLIEMAVPEDVLQRRKASGIEALSRVNLF